MIQLSDAAKHFGGRTLFIHADLRLGDDDRVGLVGPNGSGKTTLLRILAGEEPLDDGKLIQNRSQTIGYLPQQGLSFSGRSLLEECQSVFAGLLALEAELRELEARIAANAAGPQPQGEAKARADAEAERYARLQHEFAVRDGYALDARIATVLNGLGFAADDAARHCEEFSGGWQMRIALAKLLLAAPDVLLLDEPTNHLDLEARNWLEEFLGHYPHACILVSHDRYFLDAIVTRIWALGRGKLTSWTGNYTAFRRQKQQREEQLLAAWKQQQQRRQQLEVFINRFRYTASKAAQVQSRIKELERMPELELPELEQHLHFKFPQPPACGRTVLELAGVAKSYGPRQIFRSLDLRLERGDRVAVIGPNGAGKTTLIRLLAGELAFERGERRVGHEVKLDSFAQDQYKALNPQRRLLDDLTDCAPALPASELRGLLGCFLFRGDDVFKSIGVLSGGERNRYALLRLLLYPANCLLLDEPTNHLDLDAKEVLLDALKQYTGTLVFVSHDRYFLDALATKVWEVGGGGVGVYLGNYEDYRYRKAHSGEQAAGLEKAISSKLAGNGDVAPGGNAEIAGGGAGKNGHGQRPKPKRMNPQKRQKLEAELTQVERELAEVEAALAELEAAMGREDTYRDGVRTQQVMARYEQQSARREQLATARDAARAALAPAEA